jgi:alkylation response protein AidB-like acyl-CoA dehydrogenase
MLEFFRPTAIPPEDEALRGPVRAFLRGQAAHWPAERRARSWSGFDPEFSRALAAQGWVGLTLPQRYGGAGRSPFARFVLVEELLNAGAPVSAHWIADRQSGPLVLRYGTEAQRQFYLPRICRGEAFFCIGMSEPNSGSDLASVSTRATRIDRGWRIDGQKIWTTNAYRSQYMLALVRSSGKTGDRQQGLSQFIIDLSLPGVEIRPIEELTGDRAFCEVFFHGVELPEDALIGNEGAGWEQVNAELAFERSGPERFYSDMALLQEWFTWLRQTGASAAAQALAGRIAGHMAVLRALSIAVTGQLARGENPLTAAAVVKDLGTTLEQFIPEAIGDLIAQSPEPAPPVLWRTLFYLTHIAPSYSLRGGTREILRGMIARGLGLR